MPWTKNTEGDNCMTLTLLTVLKAHLQLMCLAMIHHHTTFGVNKFNSFEDRAGKKPSLLRVWTQWPSQRRKDPTISFNTRSNVIHEHNYLMSPESFADIMTYAVDCAVFVLFFLLLTYQTQFSGSDNKGWITKQNPNGYIYFHSSPAFRTTLRLMMIVMYHRTKFGHKKLLGSKCMEQAVYFF